jgi:hypothetical protein
MKDPCGDSFILCLIICKDKSCKEEGHIVNFQHIICLSCFFLSLDYYEKNNITKKN